MNPQNVLDFLKAALALIWGYTAVKVIVSHIMINLVVALAAAQKNGDLDLSKLAEFLTKKLLPFVAAYVVCNVFGEYAGLPWLAPAIWTIIEATLSANLIDNLGKLGVPLPEALGKITGGRPEALTGGPH
jgi:phage-related holin